jgi:hypothetical protein
MPTPPPSDNSHLEAQILILQQTLNHFKEQHKEDIKQLKLQVIKMQRKIDDFENQLFSIQQRLK